MKAHPFFVRTALLIAVITVNACAGNVTPASDEYISLKQNPLPHSSTLSGSYLAGRFAQRQQDWFAAQNYLGTTLEHDDDNTQLRQKTFLLSIGANNHDRARKLAIEILSEDKEDGLSIIFMASDAMAQGDYSTAQTYLNGLPENGFGQYTKPLLSTWALVGQGKQEEALALLEKYSDKNDPTYHLHAGMIAELANDMNTASEHYVAAMSGGLTMHTAVLIGNFFQRYGQPEMAEMIFNGLGEMYPYNPFIATISDTKNRIIKPNLASAAEGAGFVLFDLATMLYEKRAYDSAQIYSGVMHLLMPDSDFALLMMGDLSAMHKQYPQAVEKYKDIKTSSPLFWLSRMRIAEVYETSGHLDRAVNLLQELTNHEPTRINALVTIGDIHRRHENFAGAVEAYDAAVSSIDTLTATHWPIIYARGMALERLNMWNLAEKDLLKALEFQPNNPIILNFIGYTWADKGVHMAKAFDFIKRAVILRPEDGYILDSYGWALYRNGDFEQSMKWMERAVHQIPEDPTILDHLGDVYWQVGRQNEARFKWQHAREMSKDEAFRSILKKKYRYGIPMKATVADARSEAEL